MAVRAKEDGIDRATCLKVAQEVVGVKMTLMNGCIYPFIKNVATLAEDMFNSRNDIEYLIAHSINERVHAADVLWAGTLFAQAAQFGSINYDDVAEITNPEVADFMRFVRLDGALPIFHGIELLLTNLGQCNASHNYGPIMGVLANTLLTINRLGKNLAPIKSKLDSRAITAALWGLHYTVEQLDRANCWKWSRPIANALEKGLAITKAWTELKEFPTVTYKHSVAWKLDTSIGGKLTGICKYDEL